jgi:hypothetical protein
MILIEKSVMKRDKNLKITPKTHEMLKQYCEENGLKMFAYIEVLIKRNCILKQNYNNEKDMYNED